MRCLTLAEEFKKNRGAETKIYFISRCHKGNLNKIILEKKFQLIEMPLAKKKSKRGRTQLWNKLAWCISKERR